MAEERSQKTGRKQESNQVVLTTKDMMINWRCNQSIKEIDDKKILFTNQSTYKQVGSSGEDVIILIDNKGNRSGVHRYWFTSV